MAELDLAAAFLERLRKFGMLTADHGRTHVWIGELIDRQAEFVEGTRIGDEESSLVLNPPSRSPRHARDCVVPARQNPFGLRR